MPTLPIIDVDLDLTTDDHDEDTCVYGVFCDNVATAYVITNAQCEHIPNPMPVCEHCLTKINEYIEAYGSKTWACNRCLTITDILGIKRK